MLLAGSGPNNVSRRDVGTTASQRRDTKQHCKGKAGSKLREKLIQNITRLFKRFHGFASSWSLLNQRKKVAVCVATSQRHAVTTKKPKYMAGRSLQNSTCHVKDNKT